MRRIVHLSDIHFGSVDLAVAERAVEKINMLSPDVVVVSGDLTQRARSKEFRAARAFLDELPLPQIVVPGNHDVPLYNVYHRFAKPLDKFRKYITDDLTPAYIDDEIAVIGINTARSMTIKGGRINKLQVAAIKRQLGELPDDTLKVIVTHHPFDLPEGHKERDIVGRAQKLMSTIAECGADVFLAGHLHMSHFGNTAKRYKLDNGRAALVIQAGTATSTRGRGEAHSFNVIEFENPIITVRKLDCQSLELGFREVQTRRYEHTREGWTPAREA